MHASISSVVIHCRWGCGHLPHWAHRNQCQHFLGQVMLQLRHFQWLKVRGSLERLPNISHIIFLSLDCMRRCFFFKAWCFVHVCAAHNDADLIVYSTLSKFPCQNQHVWMVESWNSDSMIILSDSLLLSRSRRENQARPHPFKTSISTFSSYT